MKEIKLINEDNRLFQLDSNEELFYDKTTDSILFTRLPKENEEFEDFDNEEVLDIYIDETLSEWYIIVYKLHRKHFIENYKAIIKELENIK